MKYLIVLLFSTTVNASNVHISSPFDDCNRGWLSMSIDVWVDEERFDFWPSCNFSFNDQFTTEQGLKCNVDAGMCSGFSPFHRFDVNCDDGSRDSLFIRCPIGR